MPEEASSYLPLSKQEILGRWVAMKDAETPSEHFYEFNDDDTFAIYKEGFETQVMVGEYKIVEGYALQLDVRDAKTGDPLGTIQLMTMAKRGSVELVFEVSSSGETLWLARSQDSK